MLNSGILPSSLLVRGCSPEKGLISLSTAHRMKGLSKTIDTARVAFARVAFRKRAQIGLVGPLCYFAHTTANSFTATKMC